MREESVLDMYLSDACDWSCERRAASGVYAGGRKENPDAHARMPANRNSKKSQEKRGEN